MKIAVDLDEVLGDFVGTFLRWYNHNGYQPKLTKEDIVKYHFKDLIGMPEGEELAMMYRFFDDGEIANIQPMAGAQAGVKQLAERHELYVVSGRQSRLQQETEQWVEKYFPNIFQGVYLANQYSLDGGPVLDKGTMCKELGCEVLIDDGSQHVEPVTAMGVRVIILNHLWNEYHRLPASVLRADSWEEIVGAVNKMANA
jgi:5'(3')-deoxyribonucleotidase